jgi:acetylornithine deacetylase/succinyl-diaminopimelate desuccinylase family protein
MHPALQTLAELIRINSVNPNYGGGVVESEMADYVERFFNRAGIESWRQPVLENRPNVIGCIPGEDRGRKLILEAHMDTVSVDGMSIPPWEPIVQDGKMYGRGACDTKGGLAAMLEAMRRIAEERLRPACDVWLAATVDEEFSYRGVWELCNEPPLTAAGAIVAEPTGLRSVIASKGVVRFKIETQGIAAHSAKPHLGRNAIEGMSKVILAIEGDNERLSQRQHPLLGAATCNVGTISGGVQVNFVPDRCEIQLDRRLLPDETPEGVLVEYQRLLDELCRREAGLTVRLVEPPLLTDWPLETDPTSSLVQVVARALEGLGLDATPMGVPFCSDASKFGLRGIPAVILGPGSIDQAHAAVEYVDCQQVVQAAEIYYRAILHFR